MLRIKIIFFFSLVSFISCQKESTTEPFNFEKDTPVWLKQKIDSMSVRIDYYGTKVFRHEWNEEYTYHIEIPISSCAYCDLYDHDGFKIEFCDDDFHDYITNRKNEVLVWEWEEKSELII